MLFDMFKEFDYMKIKRPYKTNKQTEIPKKGCNIMPLYAICPRSLDPIYIVS